MPPRVLVAGSTRWSDEGAIRRELSKLPADAVVIHGDCAGADALAGRLAREEFGLSVESWADRGARPLRCASRRTSPRSAARRG